MLETRHQPLLWKISIINIHISDVETENEFVIVDNSKKLKKKRAAKKVARKLNSEIQIPLNNKFQSLDQADGLDISGIIPEIEEPSKDIDIVKDLLKNLPQKLLEVQALQDKAKALEIKNSMAEIDETIDSAMETAKQVTKTLGTKQDLNVTDLVHNIYSLDDSQQELSTSVSSSNSPILENCINNPEKLEEYSKKVIDFTGITPTKTGNKRSRHDDIFDSPSPAKKKKSRYENPDAATNAIKKWKLLMKLVTLQIAEALVG